MIEIDVDTLLTGLLGVGAVAAVAAVAQTLIQRDQVADRLRIVAERRRQLASQTSAELRSGSRAFMKRRRGTYTDRIITSLKLLGGESLARLKREMSCAGWRDPSAPAAFIGAILTIPLIFGVVGIVLATGPSFHDRPMMQLAFPLGFAAAGALFPRLVLVNAASRRRAAITRAFPDALDLVVICVEAGLSPDAAFSRVTEEMAASAPTIAEEFGLLTAELAFLPDRKRPLENLSERTGLASMRSLSTTLLQSEKYGTPVALGLRILAQESRDTRMAAAEKKAASLPAKLTVPMITFFLPVLFAVIAGPAAIQIAGM